MMGIIARMSLTVALLALPFCVSAAERVALVIGMGAYQNITPLDNTTNDANAIAATLEKIGFDVTTIIDAPLADLNTALDKFAFDSETSDLALIYYAGHGVEVQGENFLIPVDVSVVSNQDVQRQSISLKALLKVVDKARKMRVVILDSCRNNPFGDQITPVIAADGTQTDQTTRGTGGLAPASPDRGTQVVYAASDGAVALDGLGENSPFATALIAKMQIPGLEIGLMFREVRDQVLKETDNLQEPHVYGSLSGVPFFLAGPGTNDSASNLANADLKVAWAEIKPEQEQQLAALADGGDTRSMLGLAYIRLNPVESRYDPASAVALLEKAVAAGNPEAEFELGKLYENGIGVEPDPARALALYNAAAEQNFADAINDLGFLHYQGGLGLTPDPQLALKFFERAADLRHPQAMFNYASLIDDGLVPNKGPDEVAAYLYDALRSGSTDVLKQLTDRPQSFSDAARKALQARLAEYKFYQGTIDGDFGPGTQRSIRLAYGLKE